MARLKHINTHCKVSSIAVEIVTTQKGGEALIWQECKFTLNHKMANGKKYWRCAKRICPARITTEGNEVLQQTNGHSHPVDGVEAEVERVKHNLRNRAREEVTPIPTIYNDALVDIATQVEDEAVPAGLPTFPSLKSSMYRSMSTSIPSLKMAVHKGAFMSLFTRQSGGQRVSPSQDSEDAQQQFSRAHPRSIKVFLPAFYS